jgi:hypothetical protein
MRHKTILVTLLLAASCGSKPAQPGDFTKFIPVKVGDQIAPICTKENSGNRYILEGVLKLPDSSSISDGKTNLDLYQKLNAEKEGEGPSLQVEVKTPGDINDIWASAEGVKGKGYNTEEGTISEEALIIHTKDGDVKAGDSLKVTVEIEVIKNFQTDAVSACLYKFVEAEKKK